MTQFGEAVGILTSPGTSTETSDHLQPQLSRQSVVTYTAQDSGTSERREMARLFPFYRQCTTAGMKTSLREPRKCLRSSALSSGGKKSWKLQNCDKLAQLLLCVNVYSQPLEFGSNEYGFERFSSFVRDINWRLFVYFSQQRLILY